MIKILMKKQLKQLFSGFFVDRKTGKSKSKGAAVFGIVIYIALILGCMGSMFGSVAYSMCAQLCAVGLDWMYMAMMAMMSLAIGIFGSVFNTYASIYQAKDNDLMLSLPIPVRAILFSRLAGVYVMGAIFAATAMVPGIIVYGIVVHPGIGAVISAVIVMILLTFVVLVLSCILGWVVGKIGNKTKNKSYVTVILSLAFIAGYYAVYMNANKMLTNILANSEMYSAKIKGAVYPLYSIGCAATGNIMQLAFAAVGTLVVSLAVWIVLERSFIGIVTTKPGHAAKKLVAKRSRAKNQEMALLIREFRRLASSAIYMLNCSLGTLLMLILAVICLVKGHSVTDMISKMPGLPDGILVFGACIAVCAAASMNDLTAPSVSLEGKTLWIVRSLPVTSWQILRAKIRMHVILTMVPAMVLDAALMTVVKPSLTNGVMMLLIPCLYVCLTAYIGLAVNLKMPKLDWTSETAVVKQSMGVLVALLSNFVYIIVLVAGYVALGGLTGSTLYLIISAVLTAVIAALFRIWLKRRGVQVFEAL